MEEYPEEASLSQIIHTIGHCKTPGCRKPRTRMTPPRHSAHLAHYCSKNCYEAFAEEVRRTAKERVDAFMRKNGLDPESITK